MHTRWSSTLLLSMVAVIAIQQAADAGPFKRRLDRRQSEIESNVGARLKTKMGNDINREMGIVSENLEESNQLQFEGLSAKQAAEFQTQTEQLNVAGQELKTAGEQLKALILADFAKLRAESQALVAAEAKKLEEQTSQHIKTMQTAAEKKIADESKRLEDIVANSVKTMKTAAADELAMALEILRKQSDVQSKKLDDQLAKIPEVVNARVDSLRTNLMPEISAAIKQEVSDAMPKPEDKSPEPETPENAIVEPTVTPQEQKKADGEGNDDEGNESEGNEGNESDDS
ncbi:MAG: hypothetical protein ACI9G1_000990 [Pirellulaceae bacterium]|jgi:hypothetical protein